MSSLLALSASHLAWQTKNPDTTNLGYHHRGVALKGLHEAIGAFSRENSDAILAASMLLSWQATEWYACLGEMRKTFELIRVGEAGHLCNKACQL
jgi:hypothetical protein